MLKAIFNRKCMLVGWYDQQNRNIFSKELLWIGFVTDCYFFDRNAQWLGGFVKGTFVDKMGKPVAWIEGCIPEGCNILLRPVQPLKPLKPLEPLTPLRPLAPLAPLRPLVPLGGWSEIDWYKYIGK